MLGIAVEPTAITDSFMSHSYHLWLLETKLVLYGSEVDLVLVSQRCVPVKFKVM